MAFSKATLDQLLATSSTLCVSIYLPTREAGQETRQNPIRFKNLMTRAKEQLEGQQGGDAVLEKAWPLLDDNAFWQHQSEGLAVFLSPGQMIYFHLPMPVEERAAIAPQFHIRPLLPLLQSEGTYYILAISQNKVRLLKATRSEVAPVEATDLPSSLAEALRFDDPEEQLQMHSTAGAGTIFHGQGGGEDTENSDLSRFLHKVDGQLTAALNAAPAPLVLVGVEDLCARFKQISDYKSILDEAVFTNPDVMSEQELLEATWAIASSQFERSAAAAKADYDRLVSAKQVTTSLEDMLNAAHDGQVDTLFAPADGAIWGQFDAEARQVTVAEAPAAADVDLINLAAIYTLNCGGQVLALPADEIPGNAQIAATLRYPMPREMTAAGAPQS